MIDQSIDLINQFVGACLLKVKKKTAQLWDKEKRTEPFKEKDDKISMI